MMDVKPLNGPDQTSTKPTAATSDPGVKIINSPEFQKVFAENFALAYILIANQTLKIAQHAMTENQES